MKKVTLIIPVYNAKKYLRQCFLSVANQDYQNIEVLAIDDGSTDGSGELAEDLAREFTSKGHTFTVLHKENGGVASARNLGIKKALGDYLMFMDNDDLIQEDYVSTLEQAIEEEDLDLVVSGFQRVSEEGKVLSGMKLGEDSWSKFRMISPWARILKTSFVRENALYFGDFLIGEDSSFNVNTYNKTNKIKTISYQGYQWMYRETSVSNTRQKEEDQSPIPMLEYLLKTCSPLEYIKKEELEYFVVKFLCWHQTSLAPVTGTKTLLRVEKEERKWLKKIYPDFQKNPWIGLTKPKSETASVRMIVSLFARLPEFLYGWVLVLYHFVGRRKS